MLDRTGWVNLREFLEEKVVQYNNPAFIESDPVCIPHRYTRKQDIEIAGLFAAVLAWGQRKTVIRKCTELMAYMDDDPFEFIIHHSENDLKTLLKFRHRTFQATDTLYFIHFLKKFYSSHNSLECMFLPEPGKTDMETGLIHFHNSFFCLEEAPQRTRKHIPTPARKSTCKRINMYLRWMVRKDGSGVDFGIWDKIKMKNLICPVDLHVDRIARRLGLIERKQTDWLTALELTNNLLKMDPEDPVKFDFALFGIGIIEKAGR